MANQVGPLRVALVGFGYWGANLARNVDASSKAALVGIVESDPERRAMGVAAHSSVQQFESIDDALSNEAVEALIIATPVRSHVQLATAALQSGKHVLVEKPLATNAVDAAYLRDLAAQSGLVCMVGHTFLYSAPVQFLRRQIQGGDLGAIKYLYSQRLNLGRVRQDCNALWNFAPHDVSIILHLLGEMPVEVSARGAAYLQPGIDDICFATLEFASGIVANVHVSWLDPRKTRLMTVVGDQKMAVFDDVSVDRKISIYDSGVNAEFDTRGDFSSMSDFQWRTRAGHIEIPQIELREPLLSEIDDFAECCRSGSGPIADAQNGVDVVAVLEAIDRSCASKGSPVSIEW